MVSTTIEQTLTFEELEDLNIIDYFDSINQGKFEQTAALFAEDGELLAPFEQPIVGRNNIQAYLSQEAPGMKLFPKSAIVTSSDINRQIQIKGKVKTSLLTVDVGWLFSLNHQEKINTAKIKLLASP